ncbi:MAG: hypothetical protein MUF18_13150 [Fimbriiglobus sp.]|nr:hypothetical protein [Fimbriiglobus sp.]
MPILNCPTCGSKLEVADDDLGHKVECGSCQQTFTAEDPATKKNDGAARKPYKFKNNDDDEDDDRPSRRRRQVEDEDHDDDDDDRDPDRRYRRRSGERDYEDRYGGQPQTGMGVTSLVMGVVSIPLTMCYGIGIPCAILGIVFGILSLKTAGRGMGIAGICTSAASLLLLAIVVIVYVVFVMSVVAAGPPGGPGVGAGGGR